MGVPLRVVSYNIHSMRDDLEVLASVVRGLEADVVIVQEAPRRWRWRTKCATLANSFGLVVAAGGLPSLGNLVMTSLRVRLLDQWCLKYPLTAGRHMRGAAFARCAVAGAEPFVVVGSHLATDDGERPSQAGLLKPALAAAGDPVIVGMDLNETPDGQSWQLLAEGLVDRGTLPTYPANGPHQRIDAVFVDPRLTIERHELAGDVAASDHLAIVVDLRL